MKKRLLFLVALSLITSLFMFSSCEQNVGDESFISKNGYLWIMPGDTYNYSINLSWGTATLEMTNNTSHWVAAEKANLDWVLTNGNIYPSFFNVMSDSASPGKVTPSQYTVICNMWNEGYGYNMSVDWGRTSCTVIMNEE